MRLLIVIPHYFRSDPVAPRHGSQGPNPTPRLHALGHCLASLRQLFGRPQCVIDIARRTTTPANTRTAGGLDVIVCTTGQYHLLGQLPLGPGYFTHRATQAEPLLLGYECHAALRERLSDRYDFYGYLEDDLLIRDPLFFVKLRWFVDQFGEEALLMPNRFEVARDALVHKAYIDGPIRDRATQPFQDTTQQFELIAETLGMRMTFQRTTNPHSGAFFLTANQLAMWVARPYFLDRATNFIGPLESAATLGVMRTFRIYKPAPENAAFLEIEHPGNAFLGRIKPPASPGGAA